MSRVSLRLLALILIGCALQDLVSANNNCATLYSSKSYQGQSISLNDRSKHAYLSGRYFSPNSARVTPGCFLTIFDYYGQNKTTDKDEDNLGWGPYSILDASCCECNGCKGASDNIGLLCARLYENARCDSCGGFRLDFRPGDAVKNLGPLTNKMTSVAIRPGCTLTVFPSQTFQGHSMNLTGSNNMLGNDWNKKISSAICGCDNTVYPTYPPTRPPMTLPTVPTRPPMTLPTVPTQKPTWITTTRPGMTLPTVPTRPPMTLPTVPTQKPTWITTTRPVMTLPTVPTKPPMTLPTVTTPRATTTRTTPPPSSEDSDDYSTSVEGSDEDWFGNKKSEEVVIQTTTTAKTTTTTKTTKKPTTTTTEEPEEEEDGGWGFETEEEDDDDDW